MIFDFVSIGSGVGGIYFIENILKNIIANKHTFSKKNNKISLALIDKK